MNSQSLERRGQPGSSSDQGRTTADIVRLGLAVQELTGTVSAIEFLKANGISGAVIQRTLSGTVVRAEDRRALGSTSAVIRA